MYSGADTLTGGFPHSEIRGSTIARISPQLIAACHVLHRLLAPRHPPNALIALHKYHQCPHAGPNPTTRSSANQTNAQAKGHPDHTTRITRPRPLSLIHSLFCSRQHHASMTHATHTQHPRDQPIRFTCQTSRHLDPAPLRNHHQATNLLCSRTHPARNIPGGNLPETQPTKPNRLETVGIEPTAPCLQSRCSTTELRPHKTRNADRKRHPVASAIQLPRGPQLQPSLTRKAEIRMGQGGLEPPTPRLSSVCSNQLSYWPQSHKGRMNTAPIRGTPKPANPAGNTRLQTKTNLSNRAKPAPPNPSNKIGIRGQRPGRRPSQILPTPGNHRISRPGRHSASLCVCSKRQCARTRTNPRLIRDKGQFTMAGMNKHLMYVRTPTNRANSPLRTKPPNSSAFLERR